MTNKPSDKFQKVLQTAFREGHAWNPSNKYAVELKYSDIKKLKPKDKAAKELVASFQASDANLDLLSNAAHGRDPYFDGDVGPATIGLISLTRCGCPTYVPDDLSRVPLKDSYEVAASHSLHKSQVAAATGSGAWPSSCEWSNGIHTIRVAVNEDTMPAHYQQHWSWLKKTASEAYAEIGLDVKWVDWSQQTTDSEVNLWWRVLRGSTIGLAEFPNGTCNDNVFCNLDPGYRASRDMLVILLIHELGHNNRLQHTRGGIMNPSILRVPPSWRNDPSYRTLKRYYGGEPINTEDPELRKLFELFQEFLKSRNS